MSRFLQEIITDKNLVWDKSLENKPENFLVKLSSKTINELKSDRKKIKNLDEQNFPELKKEINKLKNTKILHGVGFLIINGKSFLAFSKDEIIKIYEMICKMLGTLYVQNINSDKIVEIKDRGKSMMSGGRYHQTREGGSYHTDSPHWTNVPDLVGLLCVNQAKKGGTSKFVSAYTIHNQLLNEQKDKLKTLYEKFHFDKRGEFKINESQTVFEPIFAFKDNKLFCRFLNDYIVAGHEIQNYPLSELQKTSLQSLEKISKNENNVLSYDLKPGDMIFFDNHRILHGRTMFEDYEDESKRRSVLRTWIKFESSSVEEHELVRIGHNFLGLINDLKRRPKDAAQELNIPLEDIMDIIEGRKEISPEIIARATKIWAVNTRDFYLIKDDCPSGVKIMRAKESEKSSRVMERGGMPYYEYRDTVMSSVSLFRPEWIEELCVVDDNNPDNPMVQWNYGHFMHQFTYFIGEVNYYYRGPDGRSKTAVMNTGDSVYGTPFRPHSFATRKGAKKNGLILALTYGNQLAADTQQELSAIGEELGMSYWLDCSSREKAFGALLSFHRKCACLSFEEIAKRTGIDKDKIIQFENGLEVPSYETINVLAKAMNVNSRDLLPPDDIEDKVIVQYYKESPSWYYPESIRAYKIVELSHSRSLPFSKAFEFSILKNNDNEFDLQVGLHQWIYNVGNENVHLNWQINNSVKHDELKPGDSAYIKPNVPHNFRGGGKLMVLRIAGRIAGDAQRELSILEKGDVSRAISETKLWFKHKEIEEKLKKLGYVQ